jgi:hypothetical protein
MKYYKNQMIILGKCWLHTSPKKGQKEGFFVDRNTLRKLLACGMLVEFCWSLGCSRQEREHMKILPTEALLDFILSGMKTREGKIWDGCPLHLDDRVHEKWYYLVPELNSQPLESVKEWIDKRFSHACYRNATDVEMFPSSYSPEL